MRIGRLASLVGVSFAIAGCGDDTTSGTGSATAGTGSTSGVPTAMTTQNPSEGGSATDDNSATADGSSTADTAETTDTTGDTGSEGSDSATGSATGSPTSADSTRSTGASLGNVVVAGTIAQGDGAWAPPLACVLRLYGPDDLEPGTGSATDFAATVPITIDEFPYDYTVTYDDVPNDIENGWEGYLGVRCDFDNDGRLDTVGAYYPDLPAALVTVPLDGLDMSLVFL